MKLFLNDWSFTDTTKSLSDNWDKVQVFESLAKALRDYGVSKIIVPADYKTRQLCDFVYRECFYTTTPLDGSMQQEVNTSITREQKQVLTTLTNYFISLSAVEYTKESTLLQENREDSILLGNSYDRDLPTVSFTFDQVFASFAIQGIKKGGKDNGRNVAVKNLYDTSQGFDLLKYLVSVEDCKSLNPLQNPLWNTGLVQYYFQEVGETKSLISKCSSSKRAILTEHATMVAELNGWEYDPKISGLNSNKQQRRVIFRSAKFLRHNNNYLSIDYEKDEVYFELLNHRGKHQGEYKWNGEPSSEADTSGKHDILV